MKKTVSFQEQVWQLTQQIPAGRLTTYGLLARALRHPGASRAVGRALHANQHSFLAASTAEKKIPCHRVVRSDGTLGGFNGGLSAKKNLLQREGVTVHHNRVENFSHHLFRF